MSSSIELAIRQICDEKGLSYESVLETIGTALAAAYRKDFGDKYNNLEAQFDPETGGVRIFDVKTVVEDISLEELEEIKKKEAEEQAAREARRALGDFVPATEEVLGEDAPKFNPKTDIMISDARVLKMTVKVGETLRRELQIPGEFGRMAAMTAKQVITQKLREAEREIIFNEYKGVEHTVIIGTVQRREGRVILVDIGRTTGIVKPEDQMTVDKYRSGDRLQFYVREVSLGARGPQILLSRTHEALVRHLFSVEIPEISEGTVSIKAIAREAGARTKLAVASRDPHVDPIGACIGQRGTRIQTIIAELAGEKIDIIEWSEDPKAFLEHALAPAKIASLVLNEQEMVATVMVSADQLSLAIGRGGQNVRLASRLTGWKVNIQEDGASKEEIVLAPEGAVSEGEAPVEEEAPMPQEEVPASLSPESSDASQE
ncbi:transcription termination/antitermination protein NusA [Patescibacteria group bacterium]|nr:transcription termination/antitermination protein NusA [Patescibacteria group bacterium]